jgi:hypothetical protein
MRRVNCSWASLAFILMLSLANLAFAYDNCPVCGNLTGRTVYRMSRLGREDKVIICETCAKLETVCASCGIPVKRNYMRLADGRLLCNDDAKTAILTQDAADRIFDDVKREVQSTLAQLGSLPHHNISFILEAKARLDKTGGNLISAHDDRTLLGLTRTTQTQENGREQFKHTIYALYGMTRERFMVVAAHEYGHTWLHENVKRKLNQDTEEGFCDWVGYKIISNKNAPHEMKVLLESDYSRGQLQAFIAAEKAHGFYHVMNWVKNGLDPELEEQRIERVLVLRDRSSNLAVAEASPAALFASMATAAPRAKPTNLVLKGLSGSAARRFALINDGTFMANERGKVQLGDSNVVLHCLEIRNDSVIVQVSGEKGPRTLLLKR